MNISVSALHQHSRLSQELGALQSASRSPVDGTGPAEDESSTQAGRVNAGARMFSFGPFHLIPTQRLLLEAERPLRIGSRALDILIALVERRGELVSKEELMARVWPKMFVEPSNLTVHVAALRRVLCDGRSGNRYLVNIPGRGYRFVAPVSVADGEMPVSPQMQPIAPNAAHNLPAQVTKLVGRADTLRLLTTQLSQERFVTIVGSGGVGKTSVALAVAEAVAGDYEHGVWLVDLAHLSDPRLVPSALASVLGLVSTDQIPSLVEQLRGKQMLLILDNCAHVVEAAASLAVGILRGAPGVRILATSREPLRVEGERRHRLLPLEVPCASASLTAAEALRFSAIELFVQRASERLDDFELRDRDVSIVVDLCRKLDGLPLTIEFAAGQIDTFGVRELSARLAGDLQLLSGGYRTALPRHQTLRAMLDSSYDRLPEPERVVLQRLSIFDGEFSLEAANIVAAGGGVTAAEVIDYVASLARKSLVTANVFGKKPVYRLLETTRCYAQEKLRESGEFDAVARRHTECCPDLLSLAEAAE